MGCLAGHNGHNPLNGQIDITGQSKVGQETGKFGRGIVGVDAAVTVFPLLLETEEPLPKLLRYF